MKRILFLIICLIGFVSAQVTSVVPKTVIKYTSDPSSMEWYQQTIFIDAGDTRTDPIVLSEPLIGIAITRDMVWDSVTTSRGDDFHWDSSWTASDLGFLVGMQRTVRLPYDAINKTNPVVISGRTVQDTLDFMPLYDDRDTTGTQRYFVTADSMRYLKVNPSHFAGVKYLIIEFINKVSGLPVAQAEKRTIVLFYRKY